MCLAIPGKIIKISGPLATVDFQGVRKEVNVSLVDVKIGEYVMVHAGFAIEKMEKEHADEMKEYLSKNYKFQITNCKSQINSKSKNLKSKTVLNFEN